MKSDLLHFEQALHGYDNGHRLLASSLPLDPKDERALLSMSDLSGPRAIEHFLEYATGYMLPGGGHYVIAKTWYASEMERPGCVWTHSILIPSAAIPEIRSLSAIGRMFFKPKLKSGYRYSDPLKVSREEFQEPTGVDAVNLADVPLVCGVQTLFSSGEPPVALLASSGLEFEELCLGLWSQLWPSVRIGFSFCTGALSKRMLHGRPLSLQCGPDRVVRDMRERPLRDCTPAQWTELLLSDLARPAALRTFLFENGEGFDRLSDVFRLSQIFLALENQSFERAFDMLDLEDPQKASTLVRTVLSAAERRMDPLYYLTLLINYEQRGVSVKTQAIDTAVQLALTLSRSETLDFLAGLSQSLSPRIRKAVVLAISKHTDIRELVVLAEHHAELYQAVVTQRPEFAYLPELWGSSLPLLEKIEFFETVRKQNTVSKQKMFEAVLDSRDPDLSSEVVKHLGVEDLRTTLDWLVERDINIILRPQWITYLRQYQEDVLSWCVSQPATYSVALILANVVDFVETRVARLSSKKVIELAAIADKQSVKRHEVTAFVYVSTSLVADTMAAGYCANTFATLHAAISESRLSNRAWQILERNLMPLPMDEWDACEKLRRAVLHFKACNQWPVSALWDVMASHVDLFHNFIRTAKSFDPGKLFFSEVRDAGVQGHLSVTKQQFKEIKKLLR